MNTVVTKKQSDSTNLLVSNLADETRDADIRSLFAQYGTVSAVRLVPGATSRRHDGCCYLTIESPRAHTAITELNGRTFRGSILRVNEVPERPTEGDLGAVGSMTPVQSATDEPPSSALRCRYGVAMVEKAPAPGDADGSDWYRYILSSGRSQITGFHRGSLAEVTEYATDCAENLNLRGTRGKSARVMAPAKNRKS
jgi:RNA recognition motif-containing protein